MTSQENITSKEYTYPELFRLLTESMSYHHDDAQCIINDAIQGRPNVRFIDAADHEFEVTSRKGITHQIYTVSAVSAK
jgi:hypothetical protein